MSTTPDGTHPENAYPIDVESGAEMVRLLEQDRLMNIAMGGLFSERSDLSGIHHIVDLACGPGGWAQETAFAYPDKEVLGVDISNAMIAYAQEQAQIQHLDNLHFEVMDITQPMPLPDNAFDLVNARAIVGFMRPDGWPRLVQECQRILRPGGVLRLTEAEWGFTNGAAVEKLCSLTNRALFLAGRTLSPNGFYLGITPMLSLFLRKAGYQHVQKKAHALDYSAGSEAHYSYYKDLGAMFPLLQPFLLQMGVVASQEEAERLYRGAMTEMVSEDFCILGYALTVWGEKP
jgi:SAM-dependent methyltransferase